MRSSYGHGVRERLPHLLVVERLALRVEEHEVRVEARTRVDDEVGVRLESIDLVASHLVDGVDRAGLQQLTLRAGVTHELNDDLLELVVFPAAPPVRIRREHGLLVGSVRVEHVGPGPGLVPLIPPGLVLALGRGAEHPDRVVSRHDAVDRRRVREHELDGVLVDDLDLLDRAEEVGGAQIQLHRAVDGVLRGVRVERGPVVERDALAELEGPGEAVSGGGPLRGQTRRERLCAAGGVGVDQRLVAVGHVHDFGAVAGARVPRGDAVERGDAQDVRGGSGGRRRECRLRPRNCRSPRPAGRPQAQG